MGSGDAPIDLAGATDAPLRLGLPRRIVDHREDRVTPFDLIEQQRHGNDHEFTALSIAPSLATSRT
jgi:hypothetical protein